MLYHEKLTIAYDNSLVLMGGRETPKNSKCLNGRLMEALIYLRFLALVDVCK